MNDIKEKVAAIIGDTLRLNAADRENLRLEQGYKSIAAWTSARHAEIIVALEDEFQIEVDERSIPRLTTVKKIVEFIAQKNGPV